MTNELNTYYLTFGRKYPWRNGWVEVLASDYETALEYVVDIFGQAWSFLYTEEEFNKTFYPAGKLGETIK